MSPDMREMPCPACGKKVFRNDQHCLSCGVRLDAGELIDRPSQDDADSAGEDAPGEPAAQAEVAYDTGGPAPLRPERLPGGRGFFDALSRGWQFLKASLSMALRDRRILIPSLIAVVLNAVLIAAIGIILHLTGDLEAARADEETLSTAGYVVLIVGTLLIHITTYFFTAMTVHLVDAHLRGECGKLGSALARSLKNLAGIVSLAVATLVVGLILGALRGKRGGGVRRAAADTLQRGWLAITYLLLPIMILEDTAFLRSTGRAKKLHSHNVIQIVVGELGLLIASRIFSALMVTVGVLIAAGLYFTNPALLPLAVGIVLLLFAFASAFASYIRISFYTCLYLWAVAMETVGEEAPAPAPLRPALAGA